MCIQEPTATVSIREAVTRSDYGNNGLYILVGLTFTIFFPVQVTMVRQQEKLKYPPCPLSTIELEKRASRYFRMSSEHTMKVRLCATMFM